MSERSIFLAALDLDDPAKRAAFLGRECSGDADLRQAVDDLLAAHVRSGSFMPEPATRDYEPTEGPGSRVGPYKLLQQIGAGGMGAVFMAEQEVPVRRIVAVKIIRAGLDSRGVLARFEAERQALALMDHPNIAKVLDAGSTDAGRPFFVMELVKGVPITQFCDEHQLNLRERLELFVPVCHAIQHAHQKGVIHRDVKPSNVLVALYDDQPVPKVIDFGVAKAASQKLTDKTLFTAFGAVVGTLEYMSPEQAKLNQLDIDTRSDVYSLGVLLYELLTGSTPLERARLKSAALDEVLRLIREEEPPRPSTRLSTAQALPKLAAARRAEPKQLGRVLRGELDWVVMKALEKDRSRRYETANGLARDVQRYLADEAVEACPPTLGYRLRKAYRKNRPAAGVAAAFVLLLTGATALATVLALQARRAEQVAAAERDRAEASAAEANAQRQRAEEEKQSAEAVRGFLQDDLLRQANPLNQAETIRLLGGGGNDATKPNPTIFELLERAAARLTPERIETRFPGMPFAQAEALNAVGDAYYGLREEAKAVKFLERAYQLYQKARGPDDPATLDAGERLATALRFSEREAESLPLLEQVFARQARVLGPGHPRTLKTRLSLDMAAARTQGPAVGVERLRKFRDDALAANGPHDINTLYGTFFLGFMLQAAGRPDEGFREMEAVGDYIRQGKFRYDHPDVETAAYQLFRAYRDHKRDEQAFAVAEETLAARARQNCAPTFISWMLAHELGWFYRAKGRHAEALAQFQKNIALAPPPNDEMAIEALANVHRMEGRPAAALPLFRQSLDLKLKRNGPGYRAYDGGRARAFLGRAHLAEQQYTEAEPLLRQGFAEMFEFIDQRPPYDKDTLEATQKGLQTLYTATKRPEQWQAWQTQTAELCAQRVRDLLVAKPAKPTLLLEVATQAVSTYVAVGRKDDALKLFTVVADRCAAAGWDDGGKLATLSLRTLDGYKAKQDAEQVKKWAELRLPGLRREYEKLRAAQPVNKIAVLNVEKLLAFAAGDAGRIDEAVAAFERVFTRLKAEGWPLDRAGLQTLSTLRQAVTQAGRPELALAMDEAILAAFRKLPNPPRDVYANELFRYGHTLSAQKQFAEAEPHLREALRLQTEIAPKAWITTKTKLWLATALLRQQKYDAAEPLLLETFRETVERLPSAPAWEKHFPGSTAGRLAELYAGRNRPDDVKKWEAEQAKYPKPTAEK